MVAKLVKSERLLVYNKPCFKLLNETSAMRLVQWIIKILSSSVSAQLQRKRERGGDRERKNT